MYALLSLDIVERALDLPQSKVPYPLIGLDGGGVKIWIGIFKKKSNKEGVYVHSVNIICHPTDHQS